MIGDQSDVVAGNYIGTDASGNEALGNTTDGVILETGASNDLIGGTNAGSGNVISGNGAAGVLLRDGAAGNAIAGNRIGTNAGGTSYLPNGQMGVGIYQQADGWFVSEGTSLQSSGNLIGAVLNADGTTQPAGNLIAGNNGPGVWVNAEGQTVEFNTITGNRGPGVAVSDLPTSPALAPQSGYLPGDIAPDFTLEDQNGNDVSLSDFAGKYVILDFCAIWCVPCNELAEEIPGIEQAIQAEHIPFEFVEVLVDGPTPGVPATLANAHNLALTFHLSSPVLFGPQTESLAQTWGVSAFPTMYFLNPGGTIYYEFGEPQPTDIVNWVSGFEANRAFTTPFNNDSQILSNSIWGNEGLGIDLGNNGVTTNTPGTHSSGPNLLQNSPVLTSATAAAGGKMTVSGYLDSTPNMTFTIQLYANASSAHGQGQDYLGQTLVTTDSTGQATFSFTFKPQSGAPFLSATATDANGNTSEFSVVNGAGVTIVGNTLYLVGGSTTNDQLNIQPIGSSTTGSTAVQVNGRLSGNNLNGRYTQAFAAIYIIGFAGNDTIQAATSLTIPLVISAGNGIDNIQVGASNNTISLGNGNDNIQAQNGNNFVVVGNGNDNVQLGNGDNTVIAGNGNDKIQLGNGNNIVVEGNGNDHVQAGNGDNLIVGGGGKDNIQAGNGSNILIDGSVNGAYIAILDQVLSEWVQYGTADAATIRSQLVGIVTYNTANANTLQAGSGLDWFWFTCGYDHTNRKATDLLN